MKTMNDYRVGRWYPEDKRHKFLDGNGKFIDPKSIITTGAMIGNMAGNGGLNGFNLNLKEMKEILIPKTSYFGKLNDQFDYIQTIISPENNQHSLEVFSLPVRIGVRQLDIASYPSRPFYTLDFNNFKLEDRAKGRVDIENDVNAVQREIDAEKAKIFGSMPLKVLITRDYIDDIELLQIEEVTDKEGNQINKSFFLLQIQSMSEVDDFWLDSGIFSLSINNK